MEVCGLQPPLDGGGRWCARFRPYKKHRRAEATEAELAVEFQKSKDYVKEGKKTNEQENNPVDEEFVNFEGDEASASVDFDAYVIAEGGWSDSTKKLGFSKSVQYFKSIFGLVINAKYNPDDMKEKNMRSQIHFALNSNWPLTRCPIQAEFLEYLKGETHFFALVVPKKNHREDRTDEYLRRMEKTNEERVELPQSVIDMMRRASKQKGLLEMGVFKEDLGSGQQCLAAHNVDADKLFETARAITTELGLPEDVPFFRG